MRIGLRETNEEDPPFNQSALGAKKAPKTGRKAKGKIR